MSGERPEPVEGAEPEAGEAAESAGAEAEAAAAEPGGAEADADEPTPAPLVIRRRGRRVSTEPAPGYTGEPAQEPKQSSENDDRLRQDVPPHWG
ncbi:hypothetical protein [Agrococcus citreus]|uniref:Uncharacterized protein n=1 Tax=Agrococcus citreus TaxID=84643 RepID=A0ABN1YRU4_9MICO